MDKEAHRHAKFQTLDCSREISPLNLYFDRLLLLKVYKIPAKNVQRIYVSWHNLKKNSFLVSKTTKIWWILTQALESLKNLPLIGSFCAKYITLDLKSIEELSFVTLKSDPKFGEKVTCGLEYDMRNFANLHQSTRKSQNWDKINPFIQSRKCMSLKFIE